MVLYTEKLKKNIFITNNNRNIYNVYIYKQKPEKINLLNI